MSFYKKENPESIASLFSSIANRYDSANAMLSFGLHKRWNRALINAVSPKNELLDLCCGTGEIALSHLESATKTETVYFLDFCEDMLECARKKATKLKLCHHNINYLKADAQAIPLLNESISAVTMAYGIRNVEDPEKCIREVWRVLKPGGTFGILELTQPNSRVLRLGHRIYLRTMVPLVGRWLTSNREAYSYLSRSIEAFLSPIKLEEIMSRIGFIETYRRPLSGGIATLIVGKK